MFFYTDEHHSLCVILFFQFVLDMNKKYFSNLKNNNDIIITFLVVLIIIAIFFKFINIKIDKKLILNFICKIYLERWFFLLAKFIVVSYINNIFLTNLCFYEYKIWFEKHSPHKIKFFSDNFVRFFLQIIYVLSW